MGIDILSCSEAVYELLRKNNIEVKELKGKDLPVSNLKVIKNETEVEGLRQAYFRESAALVSVYANIKKTIETQGRFEEYKGEQMLHEARGRYSEERYLGPSFPAIVGAGPNGAIVHYRPTEEFHSVSDSLSTPILIDTGGHYLDGTTDTTRTLSFDTGHG